MQFLTMLFGGSGNTILTAALALIVVLVLILTAVMILRLLFIGPKALVWGERGHRAVAINENEKKSVLHLRDVQVFSRGLFSVNDVLMVLEFKPSSIESNVDLEEMKGVVTGGGYALKIATLPAAILIGNAGAPSPEVVRVYSGRTAGRKVVLRSGPPNLIEVNLGTIVTLLLCAGMAFWLGFRL
jgi:hypothetical protein